MGKTPVIFIPPIAISRLPLYHSASMPKFTVDGKVVEFTPPKDRPLNILQACLDAGVHI